MPLHVIDTVRDLIDQARDFVADLPQRLAEARKAVAPVGVAIAALLSDPALGLDVDTARTVAGVAGAIAVIVYLIPNRKPAA